MVLDLHPASRDDQRVLSQLLKEELLNFVVMVKCDDHRWWDRFQSLCCEYLANMRTDDRDFEAMLYVVEKCHLSYDVWQFIRQYNETYFRELIRRAMLPCCGAKPNGLHH